jgi:high-affinity K+ transport system ATPase subunit B
MSARIYIAPYVRGPTEPSTSERVSRIHEAKMPSNGFRGFFADLLPHRMIDKSGSLFAIEIVLLAVSLGAVAAWFAGTQGQSLGAVLAIDGLLAGSLVVGHTVRAWVDAKRVNSSVTADFTRLVEKWAYRATNYRDLQAAGMPRAAAATAATVSISTHLVLEAIEPDRLRAGDVVLVETGQTVPADGAILEGMAVVDESAVTGQSAPVFRHESGVTDVMRDSRIVEGQIFVEVTPRRGHPLDWIGGVKLTIPKSVEPAQR